ncbi:peptidylprolyl isomerase [Pseudofulvibacter geojedonensis]|uniref:Peptidylprolyl isomerase n=1 Tax=Pseudofulvibacter geojedonensis TaxID=1123758 RepID=A0ABW3I2S2_9FLAO
MIKITFKSIINLILVFTVTSVFSQTDIKQLKKDLASVTDIETAKQFRKDHPELKTKIYTYNEEKHNNSLSKKLFSKEIGSTLETEEQSASTLYKIINITPTLHYRASYIYLDGKKLKKTAIDSLRKVIMTKMEKGTKFSYLAGTYSMDRNARTGGDLGWFTEKKMFPEFVNSLKENKSNTIYDLDFPETKKYYTIKKTYDQKEIRLLQVLKITFEKEKKKKLINVFGSN